MLRVWEAGAKSKLECKRVKKGKKTNMIDPTYDISKIKKNPEWHLAWVIAQIKDDYAPLEWSKHIVLARCLLDTFTIKPKKKK